MRRPLILAAATLALAVAALLSIPPLHAETPMTTATATATAAVPAAAQEHPYLGLWVTADRRVRHRLLPGGRYDEARGNRESAYRGRYEVRGTEIFYWDDTGFTADGIFIDGVLHHGGMILSREE
ncbi:Atu4866 domain-containing protein [Xanthobacteraceae bacterium A53D]